MRMEWKNRQTPSFLGYDFYDLFICQFILIRTNIHDNNNKHHNELLNI